jgi:hypothetical protein
MTPVQVAAARGFGDVVAFLRAQKGVEYTADKKPVPAGQHVD